MTNVNNTPYTSSLPDEEVRSRQLLDNDSFVRKIMVDWVLATIAVRDTGSAAQHGGPDFWRYVDQWCESHSHTLVRDRLRQHATLIQMMDSIVLCELGDLVDWLKDKPISKTSEIVRKTVHGGA